MQLLGESLANSVRRELADLGDAGVGSLEWLVSWSTLYSAVAATMDAGDIHLGQDRFADVCSVIHAGWLSRTPAAESGYCPPATAEPAAPNAMQTAFEQLHKQQQQADGDDSPFRWPAGPHGSA